MATAPLRSCLVGLAVAIASVPLSGCHAGAPSLVGNWTLYRPKLGTAQVSFTDATFRENLVQGSGSDAFKLELSGTYDVAGSTLKLNFNDADIAGRLTTAALHMRDSMRTSNQPLNFALDWKSPDLVYMSSNGPDAQMTMALARNGAVPDSSRLILAFSSSGVGEANFAARTMGGGVLTPTTTFRANVGASMTERSRNAAVAATPMPRPVQPGNAQSDQQDPVQVPVAVPQTQPDPAPSTSDPTGGMPNGMPDPSTVPPNLPPVPTTAGG